MIPMQSWHDPIVAELHAIREQLADQYHNDLLAYSQAAELHCRALGFPAMEGSTVQPGQSEPKKLAAHA